MQNSIKMINKKYIAFLCLLLALATTLVTGDGDPQARSQVEPTNNKSNDSSSNGLPLPKTPKKGRDLQNPDCPSPCVCSEKKISCEGKNLQSIPDFKSLNLATFVEINLSGNLIKNIDFKLFSAKGNNLESLDLSSNKIDSITNTNTKSPSLSKLKSLNLSGNQIKNVTFLADLKAPAIETLDISLNPIEELGPNSFSNMKNLQNLKIQETKLRLIDELAFSPLAQLKFLNMSGVQLENHLGDKQFAKNQKLQVLDMSDNRLHEVPFSLRSTQSIERLILNKNLMSSFRFADFINREKLTYLEIKDCPKLSRIDEFAFSELIALKTLILTNNSRLQSISKDAFATDVPLAHIELLDLRGNNISTMPDIRESTTSTFDRILLSENPWYCSCDLKWITTLANRPILHCAGPEQFKDIELSQYFLTTDCEVEESNYHSIIITGFLLFLLGISVAIFIQKNEFCRRLMWNDQYGSVYYTKASFPQEAV